MIFFLLLGAILGGVSVVFALQNNTPVTVSFFEWELQASLAVVLFMAIASGMGTAVLLLLPSFIRDEFRIARIQKENTKLKEEIDMNQGVVVTEPGEPTVWAPEDKKV